MSEDKKRKAIIYQRIASHLQDHNNDSLPVSEHIQHRLMKGKYEVVATFVDVGVSGNSFQRPSFDNMITFLKSHSEKEPIAVFFEMSHFGRDSETLFKLRDKIVEAGGSIADPTLDLHINMMKANISFWNNLPWFTKLKFWIFGRLQKHTSNG